MIARANHPTIDAARGSSPREGALGLAATSAAPHSFSCGLVAFIVVLVTSSGCGILGISIAKGLSWKFPFLPAAVAPWSLVMATLLGTVVGILSGVLPARKAARLDPIAALRQE